jgi:hypothetical protein
LGDDMTCIDNHFCGCPRCTRTYGESFTRSIYPYDPAGLFNAKPLMTLEVTTSRMNAARPSAYGYYGMHGATNAYRTPREIKLEAAKAWLKERGGAHPGCLERFANRKGPMA